MRRRRGSTLTEFILQIIKVIAGILFLTMAVQRAYSEILSPGAAMFEDIAVIVMFAVLGIGLIYIRPRINRVRRHSDIYTILMQIITGLNASNQADMEKERAQRQLEREKRLAKAKGIEIKLTGEEKIVEKPTQRVAVPCPRCGASNIVLKGDAVRCEYCNSALNG